MTNFNAITFIDNGKELETAEQERSRLLRGEMLEILAGSDGSSAHYDGYTYCVLEWKYLHVTTGEQEDLDKYTMYSSIGWDTHTKRLAIEKKILIELAERFNQLVHDGVSTDSFGAFHKAMQWHELREFHELHAKRTDHPGGKV